MEKRLKKESNSELQTAGPMSLFATPASVKLNLFSGYTPASNEASKDRFGMPVNGIIELGFVYTWTEDGMVTPRERLLTHLWPGRARWKSKLDN